ncbi:unnamed protein product [Kluyveromyces dobzhanskii CBS 2104]|uniref:WGS project CCBQ000000000 data, contig 00016 n=1 Tax=Kluyveromyces dobzhanskii CBS 2104 TaxID=1427455 RepID=A0A0A8L1Z0_9SACH|nr:unnamed protein product [Kluyveromyces dobzhanskii CBS 2104]
MQETLLNISRESRQAQDQDDGKSEAEMTDGKIEAIATGNAVDEGVQPEKRDSGTTLETGIRAANVCKDTVEIDVTSKSVLEYTQKNYEKQRRNLGVLDYDSMRIGSFPGDPSNEALPFPYNFKAIKSPRPFIPRFSHNHINTVLTIHIDSEYLLQVGRGENIRYQNREIWGTDIYTDDSEILLALQHCEVLPSAGSLERNPNSRSMARPAKRTPVNMENQDSVKGEIPEREIPFAIKVDILLLPPLQAYASSTRNNVTSREWTGQIHDGLSYGIYNVEILVMDDTLNDIEQSAKTKSLQW